MFPITDGRGRAVRFGGRALDPNARAKYLNGPETALFHKGRTLYGTPEARRLLQQAEVEKRPASLVVVEGYMDAIACARAGIAAVAGQGTALTEEQMEALWRLHPEPTLCFDGDAAGQAAQAPIRVAGSSYSLAPRLGRSPANTSLGVGFAAAVAERSDPVDAVRLPERLLGSSVEAVGWVRVTSRSGVDGHG